MRYLYVSLCALTAAATPLVGQQPDPLVSDRPDFTESAVVVAPGQLQTEAGYTFSHENSGVDSHAIGELLMRIGLLPRLELRLGVNSFVVERRPANDESGFEDSFIGAKIRLQGSGPGPSRLRPAVALLLGAELPTGAEGLGSDGIGPQATVALAWEVSRRVAIGSNLSLASLDQDGDRFEQVSASASVGTGLAEQLGAYLEVYGFSKQSPDGSEAIFVNGGLTFLVSADLQFDARTGLGLDDSAPDYFVGAGFVWRVRY